jgi:hypothetical protein
MQPAGRDTFDGLWVDPAASAPPLAGAAAELGFWIGEWALEWDGGTGRNVIRPIHGGRCLLETFAADPPEELRGNSVSAWDSPRGRWAQTWWDNTGTILQLTGGLVDGVMQLVTAPQRDGALHRMRFTDVTATSFAWEWARRPAAATAFEPMWRIRYRRVG